VVLRLRRHAVVSFAALPAGGGGGGGEGEGGAEGEGEREGEVAFVGGADRKFRVCSHLRQCPRWDRDHEEGDKGGRDEEYVGWALGGGERGRTWEWLGEFERVSRGGGREGAWSGVCASVQLLGRGSCVQLTKVTALPHRRRGRKCRFIFYLFFILYSYTKAMRGLSSSQEGPHVYIF